MTRVTLYSDAPYYGGAERYLSVLAKYLRSSAVEVRAIVETASGADRLAEEYRAIGVPVVRAERPGFDWYKKLSPLVSLFRECPGDLLHVNLPSSYDAGVSSVAWAAKRAGYDAVVTTEHLPMIDRKYKKYPIKVFFSHWIDRAIAIAESNRDLLVRRHGVSSGKVVCLPNGVEPPRILSEGERSTLRSSWSNSTGRTIVGTVARLTERKGHHFLIDAVALLPRERQPLLVFVGEGEEAEALRSRAASADVDVVFTGQLEDAASVSQAFDLFVLPSLIETQPLTILEAMAGRVPVLATAIYGVPELVEDGVTGRLVPAADVPALSRTLDEMTSDPNRLREWGDNGGRSYDANFTALRMTERTWEVYGEALGGLPKDLPRDAA